VTIAPASERAKRLESTGCPPSNLASHQPSGPAKKQPASKAWRWRDVVEPEGAAPTRHAVSPLVNPAAMLRPVDSTASLSIGLNNLLSAAA
jgi:hypothetical protein